MANNIRELRVAFLLTPRQLAARMGTYPQQVYRLEASGKTPSDEWVEAVSEALGVPPSAVTDPNFDINSVRLDAWKFQAPEPETCPVGARFAIQAMVARLGGMSLALSLCEEDLASAVRNLIAFVDRADIDPAAGRDSTSRAIRLSQALQIVVVAILRSRDIALDPKFVRAVATAEQGAAAMIEAFSAVRAAGCEQVV